MHKSLYLFNPENDMALAHGKSRFVIRHSVQKMKDDLSFIPSWFAEEGSEVLVSDIKAVKEYVSTCPFDIGVTFVSDIQPVYDRIVPWGWNPALCRSLHERNILSTAFPDEERMSRLRDLSARTTAVSVLHDLRSSLTGPFTGLSCILRSEEEVKSFLSQHERVVLKAPWSGSGRGIQFVSSSNIEPPMWNWIQRTISIQQLIVGEPAYDKVEDFAMEFRSEADSSVRFAGYSFFETDDNGVYKRNWLASDEAMEKRLQSYVQLQTLNDLKMSLARLLSDVIQGDYEGYLGVDMMICKEGEEFLLHPCVEINLRMNMGVLARILFDRYIVPTAQGFFHIEYYPQRGAALQSHRQLSEKHPLILSSSKIQRGYFSLTPVTEDTSCQVYIVVD